MNKLSSLAGRDPFYSTRHHRPFLKLENILRIEYIPEYMFGDPCVLIYINICMCGASVTFDQKCENYIMATKVCVAALKIGSISPTPNGAAF